MVRRLTAAVSVAASVEHGDTAFRVNLAELLGPVRPAVAVDRPAQARRHRGGAVPGHRRVHRPHQGRGPDWDLDETSQFLVVAATLLDLKAARLLPSGEIEDAEDLALLEARDLLFARLLQYRAYKQVADFLARTWPSRRAASRVTSGSRRGSPAAARRRPRPDPGAVRRARRQGVDPGRRPTSSPWPICTRRRSASGTRPPCSSTGCGAPARSTFRHLTADSPDRVTTVARFLALLELFREGAVAFEQLTPLGELTVRWTGSDTGELEISDEYDETAAGRRRTGRLTRPATARVSALRRRHLGPAGGVAPAGQRAAGRGGVGGGARRADGQRSRTPSPNWSRSTTRPRLRTAATRRRLALLHPRGTRRTDQ